MGDISQQGPLIDFNKVVKRLGQDIPKIQKNMGALQDAMYNYFRILKVIGETVPPWAEEAVRVCAAIVGLQGDDRAKAATIIVLALGSDDNPEEVAKAIGANLGAPIETYVTAMRARHDSQIIWKMLDLVHRDPRRKETDLERKLIEGITDIGARYSCWQVTSPNQLSHIYTMKNTTVDLATVRRTAVVTEVDIGYFRPSTFQPA